MSLTPLSQLEPGHLVCMMANNQSVAVHLVISRSGRVRVLLTEWWINRATVDGNFEYEVVGGVG